MRIQARPLTLALVLLTLIAWARPAVAAPFGDCAPIGTLENFDAGNNPDMRSWNKLDFRVVDGKDAKTVSEYGKTCHQVYSLKSGLKSSDLEIMKNYAEGLPGLGFRITNTNRGDDDEIFATMSQSGTEYWAHVWPSNGNTISVNVLQVQPFKPSLAPAGAQDCAPLVGLDRFQPNGPPVTRTYAEEGFRVVEDKQGKTVAKDGSTCRQTYSLKTGAPATTDLEIIKNYEAAMPAQGFRITNAGRGEDDEIFATMTKDGVETWAHVWPSNSNTVSVLVLTIEPFRSTLLAQLGPNDCPPVPTLANFNANGPPQTRTFAEENFRVMDGNASKQIAKSGRTCHQNYSLKSGQPNKTDLEIIQNYAQGLPTLGFTITNTNRGADDEIFATMTKDGVESWLHIWPSNGNTVSIDLLQIEPFKPTLAALGPQDCPLVPSLENFSAADKPGTHTFDRQDFGIDDNGQHKTVTKEGRSCRQTYSLKSGVAAKTDLEIMKNYAEGLPAAGFAIQNAKRDAADEIVATITRDGVEHWVHIWPSNGNTIGVLEISVAPFAPSLAPQGPNDCPLVPSLVDFAAGGRPQTKPYDAIEFHTIVDGKPQTVTKTGQTCRQTYGLKSGLPGKTDLEIMLNYAQGLPAAGLAIANTNRGDTDEIDASMTKDGTESWVQVWPSNGNTIGVRVVQIAPFKSTMKPAQTVAEKPIEQPAAPAELTFTAPSPSPEPVRPDQGDFPYLASVPGSTLTAGRASPDPFYVQPADAKQPELVANGSIVKEYQAPPGVGLAQLMGLYKTALLRAHWSIVDERHDQGVLIVAHFGLNNRNIWASLHLAEHVYSITVADATIAQNQLATDLAAHCHLALTGVLFDFDKSTLKPESDAVLTQVAAMMTKDPSLKLEVQGHTDNVGTEGYNQTLSEARARSVVLWLNQHKVPPARLAARGYGKTRPIATNDTDAGRAQNRRVEIANPACKG